VSVVLDVEFRCLTGMMGRVFMMAMSAVCVMRGEFEIACLMVLGRFAMMSRRVLVMLGCFMVVLCGLFRHSSSV
jgi:hypothetical protein